MISLATIWIRTHVMPRVFVFLSYALAIVLLVSSNFTLWLSLVFPAWVFVITETPLVKAQEVLANVPALLLFLDWNVALDGRSQGF